MWDKEKLMGVMKEIFEDSQRIKPYVVVAQPRRNVEETPAQNLQGHIGLHVDFCGFSHGYVYTDNLPIDVARNILMEQCLESGAKYMLCVDEDTVLPYYGFTELHRTAEENPGCIVAGVYYIKLSAPMVMIRQDDFVLPADITPGRVFEAYLTGLGCCLIPTSVLQKLKDEDPEIPYCCISPDGLNGMPFIGEDNFFYHRTSRLGVKLLINTNVQCLHIDLASGKYTAHPDVKLIDYFTNIPIDTPLTMEDKRSIDERWSSRLPKIDRNVTPSEQ
jgi:hypothetical protein